MRVTGLKYLRTTKDLFLVYGDEEEELAVTDYTDASFQIDKDDSKSQSGFMFVINGGAVSWKSSKQEIVAQQQQRLSTSRLRKPQRKVFG